MWRRTLKYHPLLIRLTNWEFWPAYITNIPVVFFWLWQAFRARDLLFFTAINPGIETSGFFGESKRRINEKIPAEYLPITVYVATGTSLEDVLQQLRASQLQFPVIAKPNVGERGFNVALLNNADDLAAYLADTRFEVIIQEYIDYPLEFSILCYDLPISGENGLTSVCQKQFLAVRGDGRTSLRALIRTKPRARLQWTKLCHRQDLDRVPAAGEEIRLEPIGNHCRGTKFLNANHLIDEDLERQMVSLMRAMPGVRFGRFDLRARSVEDLRQGRRFKILEFNGAGSEPAHIYDPTYPVWRAYRDLWKQWALMRRIAGEQRQLGVQTMSLGATLRALRAHFAYKRSARLSPDAVS
ncbi:MAG: hypothetical protein R3301_03145 [Saprospiraceae bacterium]|nr:hypothetical protein [Saprospiraceae bacterium]